MIQLTDQQVQALQNAEPPPRAVNPKTGETFVLVRQDVYEQMRKWGESLNRAGWDDPALDIYEEYRQQP
jgi:hypothetical protein